MKLVTSASVKGRRNALRPNALIVSLRQVACSRVAGDELGLAGGVAQDLGGDLLGRGQVPVPGDVGEAAGGVVGDEVHDVGPGRDAEQLIDHGRVLDPCQPRNLTRYRYAGRARRYHEPTSAAARPDRAGRSSRARGSGNAAVDPEPPSCLHLRCRCSRPGRLTARPKDSCEWSAYLHLVLPFCWRHSDSCWVRAAHNGNLRSESATLCPTDATPLRYRLTLFQIIFLVGVEIRARREWECPVVGKPRRLRDCLPVRVRLCEGPQLTPGRRQETLAPPGSRISAERRPRPPRRSARAGRRRLSLPWPAAPAARARPSSPRSRAGSRSDRCRSAC